MAQKQNNDPHGFLCDWCETPIEVETPIWYGGSAFCSTACCLDKWYETTGAVEETPVPYASEK